MEGVGMDMVSGCGDVWVCDCEVRMCCKCGRV